MNISAHRKEIVMQVVDLNELETRPVGLGRAVAFPVHSATGTAASATVWIALEPGGEVPEHRDSAEELLYIVRGEVEATLSGETGILRAGELAVVPPMAPHELRNIGDGDARVLGFFAASTVVSTFTERMGPEGERVFVTGAPLPLAVRLEEAVTLNA
jgi:quercetin dioxygenase-like cupin family protein